MFTLLMAETLIKQTAYVVEFQAFTVINCASNKIS